MGVKNMREKDSKTLMNLRIDKDLRKKFKEKVEQKNTTMSEVTIDFIKKYIEK